MTTLTDFQTAPYETQGEAYREAYDAFRVTRTMDFPTPNDVESWDPETGTLVWREAGVRLRATAPEFSPELVP